MMASLDVMARLPVVIAAVGALLAAPAAPAGSRSTALESSALQQINQVRRDHGLPAFKLSAKLAAAAAQHSREMGVDGYFGHESVDHSAFWKRLQRWYPSSGW